VPVEVLWEAIELNCFETGEKRRSMEPLGEENVDDRINGGGDGV